MPEALVVLAVFVISVAAYLGALLRARDPAQHDPEEKLARLQQHESWLRQRRDLAERERWGGEMIAQLDDELAATAQKRARAEA